MDLPIWYSVFASFWALNAFVALWKQKFALCFVFLSQIWIASLFATETVPADLPSISTAVVMGWMIVVLAAVLAAALRAMGRAVNRGITPSSEEGTRSIARQTLELRGYTIRRFIFGGKREVRSPNGQLQLFDSEQDFIV
jgi:hypothetical protein